jgi:hypothetical protein
MSVGSRRAVTHIRSARQQLSDGGEDVRDLAEQLTGAEADPGEPQTSRWPFTAWANAAQQACVVPKYGRP